MVENANSAQKNVRKNASRRRVYEYMRCELSAGRAPTVREVQEALGFQAVQSVYVHLEALVSEGLLTKQANRARGYALPTTTDLPSIAVAVVGQVHAGGFAAAIENPDGFVRIPSRRNPEQLFALRVRGESMIGVGIMPDDLLIVQRSMTAQSGDIVVALVDDEATVKRLRIERQRIGLYPENPAFEPLFPDPEQLSILGRVVEVHRYYQAHNERETDY